jgi:hypothetical protein
MPASTTCKAFLLSLLLLVLTVRLHGTSKRTAPTSLVLSIAPQHGVSLMCLYVL